MTPRGSYRQIADDVRRRLEAGELPPGSFLPSEQSLAREYSVARGTVRAALAVLTEAGLVSVVPGQGRQVTGAPAPPIVTSWAKVAADLRQRVQASSTSLQRLPSEAELSAEHRVSRNTVRRAYRQLVEEGLVVVRHGSGAFPAESHGEFRVP